MTDETNTATVLRIAAYAAADDVLAEHHVPTRRITHEELRGLLVLAYLEGYGHAGEWIKGRIDETLEKLTP